MGFSLKKLAGIAVGVVTGGLASSLASQYFLGGAKPKGSTVFEDGSELATAAEGVPIRRMYSHLNRVTGTVVVLGPIEVVTTSRGIVHNHADLMVLWGEGEVNDITKIWTDNVQLFGTDGESDFDETSNDVSVADASNDRARYTSDSSAGGPNYLELDVGQDVTISGCTNAGNNLTTSVIAKGITQDGNDDTFFVIANASAVTEAAGANIRVEQDKPNYSTLAADSITNVEGSGSETVNTILDSLNPDRTPRLQIPRSHNYREAKVEAFRKSYSKVRGRDREDCDSRWGRRCPWGYSRRRRSHFEPIRRPLTSQTRLRVTRSVVRRLQRFRSVR